MTQLLPVNRNTEASYLANPVTKAADPALLGAIATLRDGTEDVFLATGTQLIEIAALLDAAKAAALSLEHVAQIDLMSRLRSEADRQSAAFAMLVAELGGMQASVRTLTSALGGLGSELRDVRRSVLTMRVVVLNARVTLAPLRVQDVNLSNFTESGQAVVAETTDLLLRFETTMAQILNAVELTEGMVGELGTTLSSEVLCAFQTLMKNVRGFEDGVRLVSGRGADLTRNLQLMLDATSRAVSGLQVGDSTRQQLDHVVFILSHPESQDPALQALAAELLRDTARVHSMTLEQLRTSVAQMTVGLTDLVKTRLAGFLGSSGQTIEAESLVQGSARLASAIAALHPLQYRMRGLGQTLEDGFETFRSLIAKAESLQHNTHLIGINAVLSCMRLGSDGTALKVVAEQLQGVSGEVVDRLATIRVALNRISLLGGEITANTDRLTQHSIDVPERLISSITPMIRTVVDLLKPVQQAAKRLQNRTTSLVFDFSPALRHCHQLEDIACQLPASNAPKQFDQLTEIALAQVYAAFTIEREREIFRAVLPHYAEMVACVASSNQPVEDEDSFFF